MGNNNLFDYNDDEVWGSLGNNGKKQTYDGIFRPTPESGKDFGKEGMKYIATIRFLMNFSKDEEGNISKGPNFIEKHVHYIDADIDEMKGTFDCQSNLEAKRKCELCTLFFKFKNDPSVLEQEKMKKIKRSVKYYSYIEVIEDENNSELVGKILVFPYGYKLMEKIIGEKNGEYGDKCNIFDFTSGKDFKLIVKKVGGFNNYDASNFLQNPSPMKLWDEEKNKFVSVPFYFNESTGKNVIGFEDDADKSAKAQNKVSNFILQREHELAEYKGKEWTEEQKDKVLQIFKYMTTSEYDGMHHIQNKKSSKSSPFESDEDPFTDSPKTAKIKETVSKVSDFDTDFDDEF